MLLKHHQQATVPPVVVSGVRACETVPQVAAAKGFNTLLVAAKVCGRAWVHCGAV